MLRVNHCHKHINTTFENYKDHTTRFVRIKNENTIMNQKIY